MTIKLPAKPNEHHVYDIELTALNYQVNAAVENKLLWPKDGITANDYGLSFAIDLDEYCKSEKVDPVSIPIVIKSTSNLYSSFLAYSICNIDVPLIPLFLDHQKNYFQGNYYATKDNFIGLVEFIVYTQVKNRSLFETNKRLEVLMNWVRSAKVEMAQRGVTPKSNVKTLKWVGESHELKSLSELVYDDGYTKSSVNFRNVFSDKSPCQWLKEPNVLAFLIFKLNELEKIEVEQGGKAYLLAGQPYFSDYSKESPKPILLKDRIHEVRIKNVEKHKKIRERVEKWLDSVNLKVE